MWSRSMEIFTSDAMQSNESDMWWFVLNFKEKGQNSAKKLIFWVIFRDFLFTPSYALWVTPQFLVISKVSLRYIIIISFISIAFVVVKLCVFKCFQSSRKYNFWLLLGGFSSITPPNDVVFVQKFHQGCSAR